MICANQVMLRETLAFLKDEPPVIVDWLPWNHTFGGNHNIGLTLFNGGSMYLDAGKPMPGGIEQTVRNLREVSPTVYFNVPKGYDRCCLTARRFRVAREILPSAVHAMFFSGAALSPFVWNSLDELAVQETGFRVPMLTGLGATETAPFFMSVRPDTSRSAMSGFPYRQRCKVDPETTASWRFAPKAERHAGILASAGADRRGFRRRRFLQIRRCDQAGRCGRFQRRLRFRWPHCRGLQAG